MANLEERRQSVNDRRVWRVTEEGRQRRRWAVHTNRTIRSTGRRWSAAVWKRPAKPHVLAHDILHRIRCALTSSVAPSLLSDVREQPSLHPLLASFVRVRSLLLNFFSSNR